MFQSPLLLAGLFLIATMSAPANPACAGGPGKLKLGDIELQQNGSGFRKKGLLKLYEGSLYLAESSSDAASIIAADQPMAIRIEITSGFVSQSRMLEALDKGFRDTGSGNTTDITQKIQQFRAFFSDPIRKDDVFVLSYIPGSGVIVHKNGTQKGLIAGVKFKQALFAIWLSEKPADAGLKAAMLGK